MVKHSEKYRTEGVELHIADPVAGLVSLADIGTT
jgi:hypothetical protein